jgi:hypothetical protein
MTKYFDGLLAFRTKRRSSSGGPMTIGYGVGKSRRGLVVAGAFTSWVSPLIVSLNSSSNASTSRQPESL